MERDLLTLMIVLTALGQEAEYDCHDLVWTDSVSDDCEAYETANYCTHDGEIGPGWNIAWGVLEVYQDDQGVDASEACCACGGGIVEAKSEPPCDDDPNWQSVDGLFCHELWMISGAAGCDKNSLDGVRAIDACRVACNTCPMASGLCYDTTTIADSTTWHTDWGHCNSYHEGNVNDKYCNIDVNSEGVYAYEGCPIACKTHVWVKFPLNWCTFSGRIELGTNCSAKGCQDLCTGDCVAIESWETGNQKCYECTDYELMEVFNKSYDGGYPSHVFVKQQVYHEICVQGCVNGNAERPDRCDDNNIFNRDACRNDCTKSQCGDGILDARNGEECDDGNSVDNDECTIDCRKPKCGDGIWDTIEQCEIGIHGENCTNDCSWRDPVDPDIVFELTDLCPFDDRKIRPGICGCNVQDVDEDGDKKIDCKEPPACRNNRAVSKPPCEVDCENCIHPRTTPGCDPQVVNCVRTIDDECSPTYWDLWCVDVATKECGC